VALTGAVDGDANVVGATLKAAACLPGRRIECGLGTLAPDPSRTVAVRLRPTAAGRLALTGTVGAAERDVAPANDTDEDSITVGRARVDLGASTKPSKLTPGGTTTITIKVRTRGRRPARNARVCARVPRRLSIEVPARATLRGRRVCWRIARLDPGKQRMFHVRARARQARHAHTVVVGASVRGAGVRTRRARLALRILPARVQPPPVTG
jgi:hypothetical protein